ncbi:MAG TPA: hypothetical protein VFH48_33330 [Chloroflexota bacterium]|nr:hypothetical protein [Chloroflexota bacterium]
MGLDPAIANVPHLLAWIRRARPTTFTRRDAQRATRPRLNTAADLDDALDLLEQHGYIRLRPTTTRSGPGRHPSPTYDVHPSLVAR